MATALEVSVGSWMREDAERVMILEEAVGSWMRKNAERVRDLALEVAEIDEQGVEFKVQGRYKFQLIVPSGLFDPLQSDPDDFFLACSLEKENSKDFDKNIRSLNEKIQNVKFTLGNAALEIVLNHIVNIFAAGKGQLKQFKDLDKRMDTPVSSGADSFLLQAVQKEFKNLSRAMAAASEDEFAGGITVEIPDETDICKWHVRMNMILFKGSPRLYGDLQKYCKDGGVLLEVSFPKDYPFAPPFVRVVRPKFEFHTGHVTVGGSICMELLTSSGWLPSFSMESVLVQIHHAILEGGGRLEKSDGRDYSLDEAVSTFDRVARQHGWLK